MTDTRRARLYAAIEAIHDPALGGGQVFLEKGGALRMRTALGADRGSVTLAEDATEAAPFAGAVWTPPATDDAWARAMHDRARAILSRAEGAPCFLDTGLVFSDAEKAMVSRGGYWSLPGAA